MSGADTTETKSERDGARLAQHIDPTAVRDRSDPGDATSRNFRYQHAYGVMLIIASMRRVRPYVAIWCEQHEDFLAQRDDDIFDGYQIKTSRPELGAWTLRDGELTKSIGRFIDLVAEFEDRIGNLYFVSNTEFDEVGAASRDDKRRGRCPRLFLDHVQKCRQRSDLTAPFDDAFEELQAACGCNASQLLTVLHRLSLILGPSRGEFDAALSHEHIARLEDCAAFAAKDLDDLRDELVGIVYRASSLQVTDPIRHLRPVLNGQEPDPALAAKKITIAQVTVSKRKASEAPPLFVFPGTPSLSLGAGTSASVIEQKLNAAGLELEVEYLRERARAAEYSLLEDVARRPEAFPELLQQIEQRVHGELSEAHLRARRQPSPYGGAMLIEVQDRLRRLAEDRPADVGYHSYDCLIGVAGMLTSDCRVWWGPRFAIIPEG